MNADDAATTTEAASSASERRDNVERRVASFTTTASIVANSATGERRVAADRRGTAFHRWKRVLLGGLPVVVADRQETARLIVEEALKRHSLWRYPAYLTSTNGEVTYRCAVNDDDKQLFLQADAIHADGAAHVFASRLHSKTALPERVATSDLFYDVAAEAAAKGATMYMLGATEASNLAAVKRVTASFPDLKLVGHRHGFFGSEADEIDVCAQIAQLQPDILWISMGVPREQQFIVKHRHRLTSVGIIKTSGGLFDFLSGSKRRAPLWMQNAGFEWLWRACMEPRRLGWRYIKTNPLALYLLLKNQRG